MNYSYLGDSNLKVSRICLGTMHFGRVTSEADAFRIMDRALDLGINMFDTANVYGNRGGTEEIIGRWLAQGGGRRERIVLATKGYGRMSDLEWPNEENGFSAYRLHRHLADSLRRLQTDHVDLYQVHHFDRHVTGEEFWGTLEAFVQRGDVRYVGSSNFPGWGLTKFQMLARQRGFLGLVSEQTQYNLLNRAPELEVLPAAAAMGIGVLAYMPLAGGLLTGRQRAIAGTRTAQVEAEYAQDLAHSPQLEAYSRLCRIIGETEAAVAIAWVLSRPAVTSAIVGIRTLDHMDILERAVTLELDEETLARLDELFNINSGRPLKPGPAPEAYSW
ncbi:MAG: aldo/keto reductase [Verrucomicrobia bacterium]|nr:MAG: aldo/keto reductase [Verrucomicrobiota bacterium]